MAGQDAKRPTLITTHFELKGGGAIPCCVGHSSLKGRYDVRPFYVTVNNTHFKPKGRLTEARLRSQKVLVRDIVEAGIITSDAKKPHLIFRCERTDQCFQEVMERLEWDARHRFSRRARGRRDRYGRYPSCFKFLSYSYGTRTGRPVFLRLFRGPMRLLLRVVTEVEIALGRPGQLIIDSVHSPERNLRAFIDRCEKYRKERGFGPSLVKRILEEDPGKKRRQQRLLKVFAAWARRGRGKRTNVPSRGPLVLAATAAILGRTTRQLRKYVRFEPAQHFVPGAFRFGRARIPCNR